MTNESLMTKPECATASVGLFSLGHLDFVILSSFVIGHSSLISINRLRPSMQPPWLCEASNLCPLPVQDWRPCPRPLCYRSLEQLADVSHDVRRVQFDFRTDGVFARM